MVACVRSTSTVLHIYVLFRDGDTLGFDGRAVGVDNDFGERYGQTTFV